VPPPERWFDPTRYGMSAPGLRRSRPGVVTPRRAGRRPR